MFADVLKLLKEGDAHVANHNYVQAQKVFSEVIEKTSQIYEAGLSNPLLCSDDDTCLKALNAYSGIMFNAYFKGCLVAYHRKEYPLALTLSQRLPTLACFNDLTPQLKNKVYYYIAISAWLANEKALANYYLGLIDCSLFEASEIDKKQIVYLLRGMEFFRATFLPDSQEKLVAALQQAKFYFKAVTDLQTNLSQDPQSFTWMYFSAFCRNNIFWLLDDNCSKNHLGEDFIKIVDTILKFTNKHESLVDSSFHAYEERAYISLVRALVYYRLGKINDAAKYFDDARLRGGDMVARCMARMIPYVNCINMLKIEASISEGNYQFARGNFGKAITAYEKALSLCQDSQVSSTIIEQLIQKGYDLFEKMIAKQLSNEVRELRTYLCNLWQLIKNLNMPLEQGKLYVRATIIHLQTGECRLDQLGVVMDVLTRVMDVVPDDQKIEQAYVVLGLALINYHPIFQQPGTQQLMPDYEQAAKGLGIAIEMTEFLSPLPAYIAGLPQYQNLRSLGFLIADNAVIFSPSFNCQKN